MLHLVNLACRTLRIFLFILDNLLCLALSLVLFASSLSFLELIDFSSKSNPSPMQSLASEETPLEITFSITEFVAEFINAPIHPPPTTLTAASIPKLIAASPKSKVSSLNAQFTPYEATEPKPAETAEHAIIAGAVAAPNVAIETAVNASATIVPVNPTTNPSPNEPP